MDADGVVGRGNPNRDDTGICIECQRGTGAPWRRVADSSATAGSGQTECIGWGAVYRGRALDNPEEAENDVL